MSQFYMAGNNLRVPRHERAFKAAIHECATDSTRTCKIAFGPWILESEQSPIWIRDNLRQRIKESDVKGVFNDKLLIVPLGEDPAVGDHHADVGLNAAIALGKRPTAKGAGLRQRQAELLGSPGYRRGAQLAAAPGRLVGLSDDQHDLVAGVDERLEGRHREVRGAHEDHTHGYLLVRTWE